MPKQVRGLSVYRSTIERLPQFRLLSSPLTEDQAAMLGFDGVPLAGASIVPSAEGPATFFNARGKEIVRKDLPMITKSRSINTSWKDWHGQTHHGTQTRSYETYPREHIAPPGEFLTAVETDGGIEWLRGSLIGRSQKRALQISSTSTWNASDTLKSLTRTLRCQSGSRRSTGAFFLLGSSRSIERCRCWITIWSSLPKAIAQPLDSASGPSLVTSQTLWQ